jgi:hypothetical protein
MEKGDLLKLFQEWGRGIKENDGGGEFSMIFLIYYKDDIFDKYFCKCHNVPLAQQLKKTKQILDLRFSGFVIPLRLINSIHSLVISFIYTF